MDPETKCAKCGHERKWHDPCSLCELNPNHRKRCKAFEEPTDG